MTESSAHHLATEAERAPLAAAVAEEDHPNTQTILISLVVILAVVALLVVGLMQFIDISLRTEIQRKQLEPVSSTLRTIRAEEEAKLSRYQWVRQKDGILRVPLERARALVLAEYAKPVQDPPPPPSAETAAAESEPQSRGAK